VVGGTVVVVVVVVGGIVVVVVVVVVVGGIVVVVVVVVVVAGTVLSSVTSRKMNVAISPTTIVARIMFSAAVRDMNQRRASFESIRRRSPFAPFMTARG